MQQAVVETKRVSAVNELVRARGVIGIEGGEEMEGEGKTGNRVVMETENSSRRDRCLGTPPATLFSDAMTK